MGRVRFDEDGLEGRVMDNDLALVLIFLLILGAGSVLYILVAF